MFSVSSPSPPLSLLDEPRSAALMRTARDIAAQLDPDRVVDELLAAARRLTGAREARVELPGTRADPPRLVERSRMGMSLRAPIRVDGAPRGALVLTGHHDRGFDRRDEETAAILADWAGLALGNAERHAESERRLRALEDAASAREGRSGVARPIGEAADLAAVLELTTDRARELVGAQLVLIALVEDDDLVVAAASGGRHEVPVGGRRPLADTTAETALRRRRPVRLDAGDPRLAPLRNVLSAPETMSALVVPLLCRGQATGVLTAIDLDGERPFTAAHRHLLVAFAASAAIAVATATSAADERIHAVAHAEARERRRWARELHDDTLQALAVLGIELAEAHRTTSDPAARAALGRAMRQTVEQADALRRLLTDFRPPDLDAIGLTAALGTLVRRFEERTRVTAAVEVDLPSPHGDATTRLHPDVEVAAYRIVQEALTNVARHAGASTVRLAVRRRHGRLVIEVADDGHGFDPRGRAEGFGLLGIRERAELLGGRVRIESSPEGTTLRADLPAR